MTSRVAKDEIDGCMKNLNFNEDNKEKPPWRCCSNTVVLRSEVIIFVRFGIIALMISLCFAMPFLISESFEEKSNWIALLSSLVGYILPNLKI